MDSKKSSTALIKKIQQGQVTLADLQASGASRIDCSHDASGFDFPSGNWRFQNIFAVSIAGVLPTDCLTWFQASQACALSGKRLLTHYEWQTAAVGTPMVHRVTLVMEVRPSRARQRAVCRAGGCLTW
jgi:hypothetical protein